MSSYSASSACECEHFGCTDVFEDRCDNCNLSLCNNHIHNHNCGSNPSGSGSSISSLCPTDRDASRTHSTSTPSHSDAAHTLQSSTPSDGFSLSTRSSQNESVAKRRKVTQRDIAISETRVKLGDKDVPKDASLFNLKAYTDGKSWLWNHFKRFSKADAHNSDQSYEAACNICYEEAKTKSNIKWTVFYEGSTTKLNRHMEHCHKSICLDHAKESAKVLLATGDKTMNEYLCTGANDDHLFRVLKMLVKMCLPLSFCENEAFMCN